MRNFLPHKMTVLLLSLGFFSASGCGHPDGNTAPRAVAGSDQNVKTGSQVVLDGRGSSDPDGDLLTYHWAFVSIPPRSTAVLSAHGVVGPTFIADADGTYVLSLTVHDGTVSSQSDSVAITAETQNSPPTADAGPDQNVTTGSVVTLNGGGADADGDLLTFSWSFISRPATSTAILSDPSGARPTFIADADGTYVLGLSVHDGTAGSQSDSVTIAAETQNSAPTAEAGTDQKVKTGRLVALDGSESSDPDGDLLAWQWTFVSIPPRSTAALSDPDAARPTFIADVDGTYVLSLTVFDGLVSSQSDAVTITAENSAPIANAGPDQTVTTGRLVTLNGGGTDADGDPLTFSWSFTSRPATSTAVLTDPSVSRPTFIADVDGSYVLSLTVHDGTVSSRRDSVTITTVSAPPSAYFIDYTEMQRNDPESSFTVASNKIEFFASRQIQAAYMFSDFGENYFNGGFVHEFECRLGAIASYAEFVIWALTNKEADWNNLRYAPVAPGIAVGFFNGINGVTLFQEQSRSDGTRYHPPDIPIEIGVTYYCRVSYDQNTGIMRLQVFMDAERTIPVLGDSARPQLSQAGENWQFLSEQPRYRYLYGVSNYANGFSRPITGYVADLNLQPSPD